MFRNFFREPKPANRAELDETFDELGLNPAECSATLMDSSGEDDPYNGWTAEVRGENDEGDSKTFDTCAWSSVDALRNDLRFAGLTDITVE
jgi:hypothetical protein